MLTSFLGQIDRDVVKKTHFGGFSDDEEEEDEDEVSNPSFGHKSIFFKVCLPACTKEIQNGGNGRSHGEEQGA